MLATILVALSACLAALPASGAAPAAPPAVRVVDVGLNPNALMLDEQSGRLLVARGGNCAVAGAETDGGDVLVLGARTGGQLGRVVPGPSPCTLAFDGRSGHVFVANYSGRSVGVVDARRIRLVQVTRVGIGPRRLAVDAAHRRVLVASEGPTDSAGNPLGRASIAILDTASGHVLRTLSSDAVPDAIAIDSYRGDAFLLDSRARGNGDGVVLVLDSEHGRMLRSIPIGHGASNSIVADERQSRLYVAWTAAAAATAASRIGYIDSTRGTMRRCWRPTRRGSVCSFLPYRQAARL